MAIYFEHMLTAALPFILAVSLEPTQANISYDQYQETVLDLYVPPPTGRKRSGVLVIHGGGWVKGEKKYMVANFVQPYYEKGFVVANVEYRLAKVAVAPAALQDVLKAAEWFRKNAAKYDVDPKRIMATGSNAGGQLSLMLGMLPKSSEFGSNGKVVAVINCWGITDVEDQIEGPGERAYAIQWIPRTLENRRNLARKLSPMSYVRKDCPPVLTIHSDMDQTVPYEQGVVLTKALRRENVPAELYCIRNAQHGFPSERRDEIYAQVWPFLAKLGLMAN